MVKTKQEKLKSQQPSLWQRSNEKVLSFLHASCFLGPRFLGVLLF